MACRPKGESDIPRDYRVNNRITAREVLVVLDDGERLGIMPVREAVEVALERGVDLVEVAPNAQPPVCRLLDYGRFRYEATRRECEARKENKSRAANRP